MSTVLIEIRRAKPADATLVASTHDAAWRTAYRGIIPGPELEKLISRRGPGWWESAIAFFFSGRRRHTRFSRDWSSDVCSSDLHRLHAALDQPDRDGQGRGVRVCGGVVG